MASSCHAQRLGQEAGEATAPPNEPMAIARNIHRRIPRLPGGRILPRWLWPALAAILAAALTVVAWKTGDWWNVRDPGSERNLTIARFFLFVILFALFTGLPAVVRRTTRLGAIVAGAWILYLGVWLWATWPGVLMPDSVDMVNRSRWLVVYDGFSYTYSLFNLALLDLVPHVSVLAPVQIGVMAAVMGYASVLISQRSRSLVPVVVANVVAAVSVPVIVNSLMYSRDPLFAALHLLLALAVAQAVARRRLPSREGAFALAALIGLVSALRSDGMVLIVVVPLLLLTLRPPVRAIARGTAMLVGALLVFHVLLPAPLVKMDGSDLYKFGLRLNPLSRILQTPFHSDDPERDLRELGKVIDVNKARELHTPIEMAVLYSPFWDRNTTPEGFAAFNATADRIIRNNPTTYLASRVETFGAATGLAPSAWSITFSETITLPFESRHAKLTGQAFDILKGDMTGLGPVEPPVQRAYKAQAELLGPTTVYQGLTLRGTALHWNFVPSLLLLAGTLFFWRRLPFEAAFAVIILSRIPIIFLASPAAQFKYYYSVHLGGILLLGFLLARVRREHLRRRPTQGSGAVAAA